MNDLQECPVCTLYLRAGISLRAHLDTHPKEQVIEALLRVKDGESVGAVVPQPPALQPAPQMTTAVTYQHILTTNTAGSVVPQYLQVPAMVNHPFTVSQNMGFAPTLFNPIYNPYVPQPYTFQGTTSASNNVTVTDQNESGPVAESGQNEDVGSEMDVSYGSPQCPSSVSSPSPPPPALTPSVIISRSRRSRSRSSTATFSPPPLQPSPARISDQSSPSHSSSAASPHSPLPPLPPLTCKPEDTVIVEPNSSQSTLRNKQEYIEVFKIETNGNSQLTSRGSLIEKESNIMPFSDHEVIAELSLPLDLKLQGENSNTFMAEEKNDQEDLMCQMNGDDDSNKPETSHLEIKNTQEDLRFAYADDAANFEQPGTADAVYTDLLPSSSPRLLHDLLPSTSPRFLQDLLPTASSSNAFLELDDGLRIFLNGGATVTKTSRAASPHSVIQLADSTKTDTSPVPLNIAADESMPARGELSEQESLGADSTWNMFQQEVKIDPWPLDTNKFKCSSCNLRFSCPKERRAHKLEVHLKPGKTFKCTSCAEVFGSLRERRLHMAVHVDEKPVKLEGVAAPPKVEIPSTAKHCPACLTPTSFPSLKELRIHLREVHGQVRFKCEECQTCFDDETDFNTHLKVHPLKCVECGKLFSRRANLTLHMKRHLTHKPFQCMLCPKSFITRQKLEEHINGHAGIRPIKCVQCDKTFSRHSNLIQHRNLHHVKNTRKNRDFVCRCGEVFHSQRKLEWHKEIHDNKPKSCPYCAQKFIHAASVTRHVRRSHYPEYLPDTATNSTRDYENVSCPICDRVYLRSSLSVHMRVHNGERPYQCNVCSKHFTTKWNMELHQWTHQSRSLMPYKCTQCKSAFFREADHIAHINAHKNLKPFICNVCGQKFIRKYNCLRHQEEHRKAKRFVCTMTGCNKSFHRSYYLRDHMKVHTGLRPHTCHICGKASSTKSNHNKHVKIHDTRELVNTEN